MKRPMILMALPPGLLTPRTGYVSALTADVILLLLSDRRIDQHLATEKRTQG